MRLKRNSRFRLFLYITGVLFILTVAFVLSFFYIHTSVTRNLDTHIYELPFQKGTQHRVVQGYGGLFSHQSVAAIDFAMPVGTPVCAARGGVIYSYRDKSREGGIWPRYTNRANFIIIRHDDGSFGCYWHLQHKGVLVKSGRVEAGQVIGLSGATGQVIRPHLHFSVKNTLNYKKDSFVRAKFNTTRGVVLLSNRVVYERPVE
ncbi:MAG: M23 family metallopeptidase [Bacteroidetes bacterium]|nr:M23 family metallopeptidase [Bacteroidota bacterium]